jgi:hypothetical protein
MLHIQRVEYAEKSGQSCQALEGRASVCLSDVLESLAERGGYDINTDGSDIAKSTKQINLAKEARGLEPRFGRQLASLVAWQADGGSCEGSKLCAIGSSRRKALKSPTTFASTTMSGLSPPSAAFLRTTVHKI